MRSINQNPHAPPAGGPPQIKTRVENPPPPSKIDRRFSPETKIGLSPSAAAFMGVLRAAIASACKRGMMTRELLAQDLGVPVRTIEKWMSPSEQLAPRFDKVMAMLRADGPLPDSERDLVLSFLDSENGRAAVNVADVDPDDAPVAVQVAQVFAAGGRVADMVAAMTAPDSDGGHELTAAEAAAILPLARAEVKETQQLVLTLERIVRVGKLRVDLTG